MTAEEKKVYVNMVTEIAIALASGKTDDETNEKVSDILQSAGDKFGITNDDLANALEDVLPKLLEKALIQSLENVFKEFDK